MYWTCTGLDIISSVGVSFGALVHDINRVSYTATQLFVHDDCAFDGPWAISGGLSRSVVVVLKSNPC